MDFKESVDEYASSVVSLKDTIVNEENTKKSLIQPFIDLLGYDTKNPSVVYAEFALADSRVKTERVDYAIFKGKTLRFIVECKPCKTDLKLNQKNQLFRYFTVCKTRIGVLTNGIKYQFYSDYEQENVMDSTPFFVFDILDYNDDDVEFLKMFTYDEFKIQSVRSRGETNKRYHAFLELVSSDMENPSDDLIEYYIHKITKRKVLKKSYSSYRNLLKEAISDSAKELNDKRICEESNLSNIVTTDDEILGFNIVRAISCIICDVNDISIHDTQSYCAIVYRENVRKTIVRLFFNNPDKLKIQVFSKKGDNPRYDISSVEQIYDYKEDILSAVKRLMK